MVRWFVDDSDDIGFFFVYTSCVGLARFSMPHLIPHHPLVGRHERGSHRTLQTPKSSHPHLKTAGSTLFQRLSSFLAGVGVTSLIGFYFLYQDVKRCVRPNYLEIDRWKGVSHHIDCILNTPKSQPPPRTQQVDGPGQGLARGHHAETRRAREVSTARRHTQRGAAPSSYIFYIARAGGGAVHTCQCVCGCGKRNG